MRKSLSAQRLVELLRRVEERAALLGEVVERRGRQGFAVELEVVVEPEVACPALHRLSGVQVKRVHVLVEESVAARVELAALVAVRLVGEGRADHSIRDLLAVDRDRELRFELGELLGVFPGQLAEIPLAGEPPELADPAPPFTARPIDLTWSSSVRFLWRS